MLTEDFFAYGPLVGPRGELPPVKLTWYDSGQRPAYFKEGKLPKWGDGTLFVGDKVDANLVLGLEFVVFLGAVGRNANDHRASLFELGLELGEVDRLGRAA